MTFKMKHEKVESYIINPDTMAIVPFINEHGRICSEIYERDAILLVEQKPIRVIKDSCYFYGGSWEGKKEAARKNLGFIHFAPIMIDSKLNLYFFPIESPRNDTCIWLSQPHIDTVDKIGLKHSSVIFSNGIDLPIDCTRGSLLSKLHRAAQYRSVLNDRMKQRERSLT
jgi:competence protein ComK